MEKENSKKAAKKMTEAEAGALKIMSKNMEAEEAPMPMKAREVALKTEEEVHNRLEMVLELLKLMDYEPGSVN